MLLIYFAIFVQSLIPEQFRALAEKALHNSTFKVPKKLREETKYPGYYEFGSAHFTLHKILSSSQTNDIKGYAIENNYAAIVKRKKFSIEDGFALIDISTQEFYSMEKVVASDDKINIYKVTPIDMFYVFSDIEYKTRTPKISYSQNFHWNEDFNRPRLRSFRYCSAGAGAYFKASAHARVRFRSIKKAEINVDVSLIGKIGAEVIVERGDHIKYENIKIFDDMDIPIPGLGFSFRFLGLKFEFGLFLTFGGALKDFERNLRVDIDYFKGYQFTAKRYICIKRHGTSDSGWQTDFSPIPSGNMVEGFSQYLESNYIKGTIQLNQGIKLKAVVASIISTELSFGILESFQFDFGFNPLACPFPYLYGRFELPFKSYYSFSGITIGIKLFGKRLKCRLLKPKYKEHFLFHLIKTRKYCLFDYRNNYDYAITEEEGGDDDDDQFINETSNRIISLEAKDLKNHNQTKSLISFQLELCEFNSSTQNQLALFQRRGTPFEDITTKNSTFETTIVEAGQNRLTSKISLYFWYYTGTNTVKRSNDYSFLLKEYLRKDDDFVFLTTYNDKKTESVSINLRLKYCENLSLNEMYVPSLKYGVFESNIQFGEKLCVLVKDLDVNSTDHVDEEAIFTTDGTLSEYFNEHGVYTYEDEFFLIQMISITLPSPPDSGTSVHYEICAEWGSNYERKSLLISNFSQSFREGINNIEDSFRPKIRITKEMRLFIFISYICNYNIITLKQPITYSEVQQIANSQTQTVIKTEPKINIQCECLIQRFTPIVKVNCSQPNSTHRVITNVYTLKSEKASKNKPITIQFKDQQLYGVFQLKKIHPKVKWVIINMPLMQPICNYTMIASEYYQIPFDKDVIFIPFRRQNTSIEKVTINHVIQGNFIDEKTLYFSSKYYEVDFAQTPVAIAFIQTIKGQYSVTDVNGTIQTLIDFGDQSYSILALECKEDQKIIIAPSLIIIDDEHPLTEKTIPDFPKWDSVIYHVWCERADDILLHDKTAGLTTENNTEKEGLFFKLAVIPGHVYDFIPICTKNLSQPLCYFKQTFSNPDGFAIFKYPVKNGITILDTNLTDLFEQEDRQGLIEEAIKTDKPFYYMTSFAEPVDLVRTYRSKLDLELRVINVEGKYKKFCIVDQDGFTVPVSRKYYTDDYLYFMNEFGIHSTDEQYLDFVSGDEDSCIYATYTESNYSDYNATDFNDTDFNYTDFNYTDFNDTDFNDTDYNYTDFNYTDYNNTDYNDTDYNDTDFNDTDYNEEAKDMNNLNLNRLQITKKLLSNDEDESLINPSIKICDLAKSIKVSYYKDITHLIPPATFNYSVYTTPKNFEDEWANDLSILIYEIEEYFIRANQRIKEARSNTLFVLYLPYNEITFNISLKENEFISAKENLTIHYTGGNLNCILSDDKHTTIDIGKMNEINLNILGGGTLEIKSINQSTIKINGQLNLNSTRIIRVDNLVKSVRIGTVNVVNYTELYIVNDANEHIDVKINNLTLHEHSKANLTDLEITDSIKIKQTATAFFDESVTIKESQLLIEMIAYQNDLIPMIKGALLEPPKTIYMNRVSQDGPKQDDEYMIFDGQFNCQTWIDRIVFNNSRFNTARCTNNSNRETVKILSKKDTRAFVSFIKHPPVIKLDHYVDPYFIAIFVFLVIDFGLLIVLVASIIHRKHKSRFNHSDSGDPEANDHSNISNNRNKNTQPIYDPLVTTGF